MEVRIRGCVCHPRVPGATGKEGRVQTDPPRSLRKNQPCGHLVADFRLQNRERWISILLRQPVLHPVGTAQESNTGAPAVLQTEAPTTGPASPPPPRQLLGSCLRPRLTLTPNTLLVPLQNEHPLPGANWKQRARPVYCVPLVITPSGGFSLAALWREQDGRSALAWDQLTSTGLLQTPLPETITGGPCCILVTAGWAPVPVLRLSRTVPS